ncbi:MAG: 4-demethylwyosine synthase TYW1 [Candidatus Diapherotrites archaeon]
MNPPEHYLPQDLIATLKHQHYALFGHSAVKLCLWTKQSLYKNRFCYKQKFYGIQSHRCMQMTPCVSFCEQKCVYCWRPLTEFNHFAKECDDPKEIVEHSIANQRILLSGYGALREQIGEKKLSEAFDPKQVAISLAGEPTLYPKLGELIKEFRKRKMTTFLVSNGLHPEVLEEITLPTQLYVSLEGANEQMHKKIDVPLIKNSWKKINESLELLSSLKTRTVVRITAIKGLNMEKEKEFAALLEKASPHYLEIKSYMFLGSSRERLKQENMPTFEEVLKFSENISEHCGYIVKDYSKESRVVLLVRDDLKDVSTKITFC